MAEQVRLIKKYPNRRLYDTRTSTYITLVDVKDLVLKHEEFQVLDAKSGEDLTRSILLQIILEEEAAGAPMFSSDVLSHMIRFYGNAMQGMMGQYLENNIKAFTDMQAKLQEQVRSVYGENATVDAEAVTEAALFEGAAPVLIVPGELKEPFGKKIMIAWNQSNEAMAAVRRALPLLQAAESVEITVIDPSPNGPERSDPGGALGQMLTRHGVRAEISVLARTQPLISDILNRRATEIGADMVVMGAYGHSRFRQAILGGATRNMLEKAQVPVFMAR